MTSAIMEVSQSKAMTRKEVLPIQVGRSAASICQQRHARVQELPCVLAISHECKDGEIHEKGQAQANEKLIRSEKTHNKVREEEADEGFCDHSPVHVTLHLTPNAGVKRRAVRASAWTSC